MAYFLAKTDPGTYSIDDLEREKQTLWDGVRNLQAVKALQTMRPGDRVFIYHSGGVSGIVGLAKVVSNPRPDSRDSRSVVVDFQFLQRLQPTVTLAEIKSSGLFGGWALIRQGRLSTMSVPPEFVSWIQKRLPSAKI